MGNEFEECQSVSKLFRDIKDGSATFDTEIAPDDRRPPGASHLDASITPADSRNKNRLRCEMRPKPPVLPSCAPKSPRLGVFTPLVIVSFI